MLEIIQTSSLVVISLGVSFYVLNKRIILDSISKQKIKDLTELLESTNNTKYNNHKRAMQYKASMESYQKKYHETLDIKNKTKMLNTKLNKDNEYLLDELEKKEIQLKKLSKVIEDFRVEQYKKGNLQ